MNCGWSIRSMARANSSSATASSPSTSRWWVDHEPVLGLVSAPAQGLVYWGAAGSGAFSRHRRADQQTHPGRAGSRPLTRGRQPLACQRRHGRLSGTAGSARRVRHRQLAEILSGCGRPGRVVCPLWPDVGMGYGGRPGAPGSRRRARDAIRWPSAALQLPRNPVERGLPGVQSTRAYCPARRGRLGAAGLGAAGLSVAGRLAQFEGGIQQRRDVEHDLVLGQRQPRPHRPPRSAPPARATDRAAAAWSRCLPAHRETRDSAPSSVFARRGWFRCPPPARSCCRAAHSSDPGRIAPFRSVQPAPRGTVVGRCFS